MGPDIDITRMTVLQPGELLTAIRLPATLGRRAVLLREGARPPGVGLPARQRRLVYQDQRQAGFGEARIAVGAVAARPLRLRGRTRDRGQAARTTSTAKMAGEMAIAGAVALRHNAYKVPLMRNLVRRAVRGGPMAGTT